MLETSSHGGALVGALVGAQPEYHQHHRHPVWFLLTVENWKTRPGGGVPKNTPTTENQEGLEFKSIIVSDFFLKIRFFLNI